MMSERHLTPALREEIQDHLARRYLARLDRAQWDRDFRRDRATKIAQPRLYTLKRFAHPTPDGDR